MKKYLSFFIFTSLIIACFFVYHNVRLNAYLQRMLYDLKHKPQAVQSKKDINKVLKTLEHISYKNLSSEYLKLTKSDEPKYKRMLQSSTYYLVKKSDLFRPIVGRFRIQDFIPKDEFYGRLILNKSNATDLVWLLNKKLLYKMLELLETLEKENYDSTAFVIRRGHRHPAWNEKVGGASKSRHIMGEAVDIVIGDIDKNGVANDKDKAIVLELLDKKIIKNGGGVGKYPGTKTVHFDVRGHRARWDKQ